MEWDRVRNRLAPETAAMLTREFIRERKLFPDLTKFAQVRARLR